MATDWEFVLRWEQSITILTNKEDWCGNHHILTLVYSSFLDVTMATCFHPNCLTTVLTVIILALSEEMVRRNVGNRRLSDREILVAV